MVNLAGTIDPDQSCSLSDSHVCSKHAYSFFTHFYKSRHMGALQFCARSQFLYKTLSPVRLVHGKLILVGQEYVDGLCMCVNT